MFSFAKLKEFFHKHESTLSAVTLGSGFLIDYLTLQRVDYWLDNIFIISYLLIAGASILIINLYEAGKFHNKFTNTVYDFLPFVMQFAFGGLFSAFTIFYSKSASFLTSGVFVLILVGMLVGNEFFKKRYSKLSFQAGIYFLAIFSFSIYFLPVLLRRMGAEIFLLSGVFSLAVIGIFIWLVARHSPLRYQESYKPLFLTIFSIWSLMNIFYFTNLIPPIPLSLKAGDVYHSIEKKPGGGYLALGEKDLKWHEKLNVRKTLHLLPGEGAYAFSSVFSPAELDTDITHDWQYFDDRKSEWVSVSQITFLIVGGRNEGYRGYSQKNNVFPGEWRVDVKTDRGEVIGRIRFDIEAVDAVVELIPQNL